MACAQLVGNIGVIQRQVHQDDGPVAQLLEHVAMDKSGAGRLVRPYGLVPGSSDRRLHDDPENLVEVEGGVSPGYRLLAKWHHDEADLVVRPCFTTNRI